MNQVQNALMDLQAYTCCLSLIFCEQMNWAVLDDMCKHFNNCAAMSDFRGLGLASLRFPPSNLGGLVMQIHGASSPTSGIFRRNGDEQPPTHRTPELQAKGMVQEGTFQATNKTGG